MLLQNTSITVIDYVECTVEFNDLHKAPMKILLVGTPDEVALQLFGEVDVGGSLNQR